MLLSLFMILLSAGMLISGLTYILFWYEAANTPHPSHQRNCSGWRSLPGCVLFGFLSSVSSQIVVYLTYPLGLVSALWHPATVQPCSRPPVVLVHGLYHNASAWFLYKWLLKRRGYANIFCFSYNTLAHDFRQLETQLKQAVSQAATLGGSPVVLIGHSLGGLLVRAAIACPQTAPHVCAAVVLGAPNQGSKLAALAFGRLGRSIIPGSPVIRRVNASPSPVSLPKLNLYSPLDNMVLPTRSLEIHEPGWRQEETPLISHVSMLYHVPTIRLTLDRLEGMEAATHHFPETDTDTAVREGMARA